MMNRQTSLYLDATRFTAAAVVFLSHLKWQPITGGFLWQFGRFGLPAVLVFFVLSGFVIAYVTDTKEGALSRYATNRVARIYSVALPALILTSLLDVTGSWANPGLYAQVPNLLLSPYNIALQSFAGFTFANEIWGWDIRIGTNGPYWSMGFEVWYYVIFAVWVFLARRWKVIATTLCLLIAGPPIAGMFPVWLTGVAAYCLIRNVQIGPRAGVALFTLGSILWLFIILSNHGGGMPAGRSVMNWPDFMVDYAAGLAFAATIIGVHACASLVGWLMVFERPIRWLAGRTFSLYLLHMPLMVFLRAVSPWQSSDGANRALIVCGTLGVILIVAEFTELRKNALRQAIVWLVYRSRNQITTNRAMP